MLQGAEGEGPKVSRPANVVAMQGALLEHKGKSLKAQPELNCCLILAKSGRTALEEGLNAVKDEYANTPPAQRAQMNFDDLFKCGDIINPNGGKAIRINCNDGTEQAGEGPTNWSAARNQRGGRPQANNQRVTFPHYEVAFEAFEAPGIEIMQESWVAWDKVFRYLTEAEQVDLLCTAFNKNIIMAAFLDSSFEEHIPAKMRQGFRASPGNNTESPRPVQMQRQAPQPQTQTTTTTRPAGAWANSKPAKEEPAAEGMPAPDAPEHTMPDLGQGFKASYRKACGGGAK